MTNIILDDGDGGEILLTVESPRAMSEFLRRASATLGLGDDQRTALQMRAKLYTLASEQHSVVARREEKAALSLAGERQHGEPVVILDPGTSSLALGEELSLAELDVRLGFKYAAAAMALQRAKVRFSDVAFLAKPKERKKLMLNSLVAEYGEKDGQKEFLKWEAALVDVTFCRVSSVLQTAEKYSDAVAAWRKSKEEQP